LLAKIIKSLTTLTNVSLYSSKPVGNDAERDVLAKALAKGDEKGTESVLDRENRALIRC